MRNGAPRLRVGALQMRGTWAAPSDPVRRPHPRGAHRAGAFDEASIKDGAVVPAAGASLSSRRGVLAAFHRGAASCPKIRRLRCVPVLVLATCIALGGCAHAPSAVRASDTGEAAHDGAAPVQGAPTRGAASLPRMRLGYTVRYRAEPHAIDVEVLIDGPARDFAFTRPGYVDEVVVQLPSGAVPVAVEADGRVPVPAKATRLAYRYDLSRFAPLRMGDLYAGAGSPGSFLVAGRTYLVRPRAAEEVSATLRVEGSSALLPWSPGDDGVWRLSGVDLVDSGFHSFGGRRCTVRVASDTPSTVRPAANLEPTEPPRDRLGSKATPLGSSDAAASSVTSTYTTPSAGLCTATQSHMARAPVEDSAVLEIALHEGELEVDDAFLCEWIRTSAAEVLTVRRPFPYRRATVHLVPGWGSDPSPLGLMLWSDPPSLAVVVGARADASAFRSDWVAVHELLHLVHPSFLGEAPWLTEGLATYYTELARLRSGRQTKAKAWANLVDGFDRGRADAAGLSLDECEPALRRGLYLPVYWAGALIAVELDVEIRRASRGARSLDDVLVRLGEEGQTSTLQRFGAVVDEIAGAPVFHRVLGAHRQGEALSRTDEVLRRLGVERASSADRVRFIDAPDAWIRDALGASVDGVTN